MSAKAEEIAAVKADAERDLAEAKPALDAALAALNSISPKDISALKALKSPPDVVRDAGWAALGREFRGLAARVTRWSSSYTACTQRLLPPPCPRPHCRRSSASSTACCCSSEAALGPGAGYVAQGWCAAGALLQRLHPKSCCCGCPPCPPPQAPAGQSRAVDRRQGCGVAGGGALQGGERRQRWAGALPVVTCLPVVTNPLTLPRSNSSRHLPAGAMVLQGTYEEAVKMMSDMAFLQVGPPACRWFQPPAGLPACRSAGRPVGLPACLPARLPAGRSMGACLPCPAITLLCPLPIRLPAPQSLLTFPKEQINDEVGGRAAGQRWRRLPLPRRPASPISCAQLCLPRRTQPLTVTRTRPNTPHPHFYTPQTVELLQPYFAAPDFNYDAAKKASGNVAGLCNWAASMCKYHEVAKASAAAAAARGSDGVCSGGACLVRMRCNLPAHTAPSPAWSFSCPAPNTPALRRWWSPRSRRCARARRS